MSYAMNPYSEYWDLMIIEWRILYANSLKISGAFDRWNADRGMA